MNNRATIIANIGVFFTGLTLFMYEITLTRLFSTLMWYHFVFIAISLAMLGWAVGGVYAFKWLDSQKNPAPETLASKKAVILAALSVTLWITILFLYKIPYNRTLILAYIALSALPFIFGGYYLSLIFKEKAKKSNTLYFADLLGSALGSVLVIYLLDNYSLIRIGTVLALIPLMIAAFNLATKRIYINLSTVTVAALLILTFSNGGFLDNWAQDFGAYQGNPKLLGILFKEKPRIVFTSWNSLARTDVLEESGRKNKILLMDGGSASEIIPFNGDLKSIEHLKNNVGYFPFAYKQNNSALLIGPGGGEDILYAHLGGVHNITAVEINPGSVEAARKFKDFNGNIYGLEGTSIYVQDGRSFITKDKNKYDVIFLSKVMTQSSETLGYALSENYIYTKEAFKAYFDHLNPGGTLALVLHDQNDFKKATTTLIKVLEERGIPREQASKYIAAVNSNSVNGEKHNHGKKQMMFPLLVVKTTPFTKDESQKIMSLAQQSEQQVISLPYVNDRLDSVVPPENMQKNYLVTDNYPFFYKVGRTAPPALILLLLVVLFSGYNIIKPLLTSEDSSVNYFRNYFAYLGLAFMLVEITLIQKLILLFGHPTLTFSAVIAILLFTAGLGSSFSKFLGKRIPLKVIGITIFSYSVLLYFTLPWFISIFQGAETTVKILATFSLLLPQGLLMGVPFPAGLSLVEIEKKENYIPVFWAINGWMSVVGSILALVLAMSFGYNVTLLTGALIYLIFAYHTRKYPQIEKYNPL